MKGYIYRYTFPDGKVYIGQTRRPEDLRIKEHLTESIGSANKGFWEAYTKYGECEYATIATIESDNLDELVAKLNALESHFISEYKAADPQFGYNRLSKGMVVSDRNEILNDALRSRLAEAKIKSLPFEEMCDQILCKVYDTKKPLTAEEKEFVREFIFTNGIFNVSDYDLDEIHLLDEEELFMFEEAIDAARFFREDEMTEHMRYDVYSRADEIVEEARNEKIIVQIGSDGEIVAEYSSFNEIAQAFGVPRPDNVRNVVKGKQKSAYGFRWMYKKDYLNQKNEPEEGCLF